MGRRKGTPGSHRHINFGDTAWQRRRARRNMSGQSEEKPPIPDLREIEKKPVGSTDPAVQAMLERLDRNKNKRKNK